MIYNCLIIDDEPLARRVIEKHCENFESLNIVAKCSNAFDAALQLQQYQVDIIFLDINMPKLSGINFLKSIKNPPLVIFTTAYAEYAVEGFELEAVDYLLKPIDLERFTKAILKVFQRLQQKELYSNHQKEIKSIVIKSDKKLHKVNPNNILYLEACGDYVKVILKNGQLLPKKKLIDFRKELSQSFFLQIHRSFIVNLQHIEYLEGNLVKVRNSNLPVSQRYREILLNRLGERLF